MGYIDCAPDADGRLHNFYPARFSYPFPGGTVAVADCNGRSIDMVRIRASQLGNVNLSHLIQIGYFVGVCIAWLVSSAHANA